MEESEKAVQKVIKSSGFEDEKSIRNSWKDISSCDKESKVTRGIEK